MKIIFIALFVLLPLFSWGQGLNGGGFDPQNPNEPQIEDMKPYAYFNLDVVCNRVGCSPSNTNKSAHYEWTLDGKVVSTQASFVYTFNEAGTHSVKLKVTNALGFAEDTQNFTIQPESEWFLSGEFTFNEAGTGVRNFTSIDDLFDAITSIRIGNNFCLRFQNYVDATTYIQSHPDFLDKLIDNIVNSNWGNNTPIIEGASVRLWSQFNKSNFISFMILSEYVELRNTISLGDRYFYNYTGIFSDKKTCAGKKSDEFYFKNFNSDFIYEWKLKREPKSGTSGYQSSGTGNLPAMALTNPSFELDTLAYQVNMKYNNEIYYEDSCIVIVYPEKIDLPNQRPLKNAVLPTTYDICFSWEEAWWNKSQQFNSFTFSVWEKNNPENKYSNYYYNPGSIRISEGSFKFEYEKEYCWQVMVNGLCEGIPSEVQHFSISNVPDLVVTNYSISKSNVVPGDEVTVTATITNQGTKEISQATWIDQLYECMMDEQGEIVSRQTIKQETQSNKDLAIGKSYDVSFTFTVPYSEFETLHYSIQGDFGNNLVEGNEDNNELPFDLSVHIVKIPDQEYKVLCNLYKYADGENWSLKKAWNITKSVVGRDGWEGLSFDKEGHVTNIQLQNKKLSGTIPAGLFSFMELNSLNLSNNQLVAQMDTLLKDEVLAPKLQCLYLSNNQMKGTVLASMEKMEKLEQVDLSFNQIENIEWKPINNQSLNIQNQKLELKKPIILSNPLIWNIPGVCKYSINGEEENPVFSLTYDSRGYDIIYNAEKQGYVFWGVQDLTIASDTTLLLTQNSGVASGTTISFQFSYPQGDANMDNIVNVQDTQHELNHIMDKIESARYATFNFMAANTFDADDIINVQDIVTTTNIVLENPLEMHSFLLRSATMDNSNTLTIEDGYLVLNVTEPVTAADITIMNTTSNQITYQLSLDNSLFTLRDTELGARFIIQFLNGDIPVGKTKLVAINNASGATIRAALLVNEKAEEVPVYFEGRDDFVTGIESILLKDPMQINIPEGVLEGSYTLYNMLGYSVLSKRLPSLVSGIYSYRDLIQNIRPGIYVLQLTLRTKTEVINKNVKLNITK